MTRLALSVLLACTAANVCEAAQAPAAPCLQQANMYSFDPVAGNRALIVTDVQRRRYRVNFIGRCFNLQYHIGLRFKTFGVSRLACVDKGDQVLIRDPVVSSCIVKSVEWQTPALDQADAAAKVKP